MALLIEAIFFGMRVGRRV